MLSAKEVMMVYETLLSSPGMNDTVKVSLQLPRKNVLLLAKIIEHGLAVKDETRQGSILSIVDETTSAALNNVSGELLKKGGLTEMNEKLSLISSKQ